LNNSQATHRQLTTIHRQLTTTHRQPLLVPKGPKATNKQQMELIDKEYLNAELARIRRVVDRLKRDLNTFVELFNKASDNYQDPDVCLYRKRYLDEHIMLTNRMVSREERDIIHIIDQLNGIRG
jgi:hypothetical protein